MKSSVIIKAIILLILIVGGVFIYQYTDYSQYLTKERISHSIASIRTFFAGFGIFGPILFAFAGAVAITINIPTVIIILFSVITFDGLYGAIISAASVYLASIMIYFSAQYLGRDFVSGIFGKRLQKLEQRLNEKGFKTVLYVRLIFFMLPPLNWILSLSNINFRDFFLGTFLGTIHHLVIYTWLSDIIIEVIKAGESLNPVKTPRLLLPLAIGMAIIITFRTVDRFRQKNKVI